MDKVIIVLGPTGVGKSELAIEIAQRLRSEIISADAFQVYRQLNIGTAKVPTDKARGIVQNLIDIKNIDEEYSVRDFQLDGRREVTRIINNKKIPVVAGGTGLYLKALTYDYIFNKISNDNYDYSKFSNEELHLKLTKLDSKAGEMIHPNNRKRVIRALTIANSGLTKSESEALQKHLPVYDLFIVGCTMERKNLYRIVDQRVDKMIATGLENEVYSLTREYPNFFDLRATQGIGYKEWKEYFGGTKNIDETITLIKHNTHQLIKRQYTWFNHQFPQNWYDITDQQQRGKVFTDILEWSKNA